MIGWGKNRAAQQPTGIGPQQFEKDHLGGCGCGRVSHTSPAKSSTVPDIDPIRGPIHRPAMTLRVDKGFQQHHAVPACFFPIPRQTPLTERENARPQIEQVPVRRSEEHTSELQSRLHLVCRLLLEKKKNQSLSRHPHTLYDDWSGSGVMPTRISYALFCLLSMPCSSERFPCILIVFRGAASQILALHYHHHLHYLSNNTYITLFTPIGYE